MFALPQGGKPRRFDRRVLAAVLLVAGGPILGTPPALHVQSPSRSAGASDLSDPFSSVLCSLSAGEEPLPNYCKDSVKMHPYVAVYRIHGSSARGHLVQRPQR